jgi:hypothetical protein
LISTGGGLICLANVRQSAHAIPNCLGGTHARKNAQIQANRWRSALETGDGRTSPQPGAGVRRSLDRGDD